MKIEKWAGTVTVEMTDCEAHTIADALAEVWVTRDNPAYDLITALIEGV